MKIASTEIPDDIEVPPLDDATKAEIDRLHAQFMEEHASHLKWEEEARRDGRYAGPTAIEKWQLKHPGEEYVPPPEEPTRINVEIFRKLSPRLRAVMEYIYNRPVREAEAQAVKAARQNQTA